MVLQIVGCKSVPQWSIVRLRRHHDASLSLKLRKDLWGTRCLKVVTRSGSLLYLAIVLFTDHGLESSIAVFTRRRVETSPALHYKSDFVGYLKDPTLTPSKSLAAPTLSYLDNTPRQVADKMSDNIDRRILAAIDFGTTFSAIVWCQAARVSPNWLQIKLKLI